MVKRYQPPTFAQPVQEEVIVEAIDNAQVEEPQIIEQVYETAVETNIMEEVHKQIKNEMSEPLVNEQGITETLEVKKIEPIPVYTKFDSCAIQIDVSIRATKKKENMVIANREVKMLSDRFYLVPVNVDSVINSDNFTIKIYTDMAELINVLYIKDGKACISPLQHGVTLKDTQRLCVLFPLV